MQNCTDTRTPRYSTPQTTWTFPLHDIAIKVVRCTKYEINTYNFFRFLVCSQYFKVSFKYIGRQGRLKVINWRNQNMAVLLNVSL